MLLTAVTTRKRSRILWFAERSRPYFLLHPDHLPIFLPQPLPGRPHGGSPWLRALSAWLRSCDRGRDSTPRLGILDELLGEQEFLELERYLEGRGWNLQVLKAWSPAHLVGAPSALASWDLAGFLLELSGNADYDLSFDAVGCVEPIEYPGLPGDRSGGEVVDFLLAE